MNQPDGWTFDQRPCPHCGTTISKTAAACRSCKRTVEPVVRGEGAADATAVERMLLPLGRPASAIAAGYLGLFSVLPLFGIAAIIVSVVALRTLKKDPRLSGRGRAVFGLLMGSIMTLLYGVPFVLMLISAFGAGGGR